MKSKKRAMSLVPCIIIMLLWTLYLCEITPADVPRTIV
ncbi:unnamed protein product, partial [marine sediment metagenome]